MKGRWWVGLGVAVTLVIVIGLGAGWLWWERVMWRRAVLAAPEMMERVPDDGGGSCVAFDGRGRLTGDAPLSLEDANRSVEHYLARLDDANLQIGEVMEFELNFYAIVKEAESGIGAMELLVDKRTGAVRPEVGPNMMWNARYGMRRRSGMMGQSDEANAISAEEAVVIAQAWLDEHRPGATTEGHADPFYGYYTIHTLRNDEIEGMLSVHGATGQVWYHAWHGDFVRMVEGDER